MIDREEECAAFEGLDMRDLPAVTAAREEMAEWYRPYTHEHLTALLCELELAPGTAEAFALLRTRRVATAIVSITWSFAVEWFATRLGADYFYGTGLANRSVAHVWPADKGRWLRELIARLDLRKEDVAAVGDSEGDRELLEAAGIRYCVGWRNIGVAEAIHLPGANLLHIAEQLVID